MKKLIAATFACAALAVCADEVPEVSNITMTQDGGNRLVTITYTLDKAPAVVTLDIQTNAAGNVWASIGGENIQHVSGDVWKKVEAGDNHTITWRPDLSWPNHKINDGGVRAVVTAWSVDNPPDYMVVNLAANATTNSETYYPAVEFLPGGLLGNGIYRQSSLVMRKIPARGVTWESGSMSNESGIDGYAAEYETLHKVTLSNNYYLAVFETTQAQWALIMGTWPSNYRVEQAMRPVESISYNKIRNSSHTSTAETSCYYPNPPHSGSFLGLLREKTGLAFDLPSEAQWEFACRVGHGSGYWNDGTAMSRSTVDDGLARLGRYASNGGINSSGSCGVTNGTAIVGSYAPNAWGLYDMHGNVWEWCLDWYEKDITTFNGAVNVNPNDPTKTLSGAEGTQRTQRGGGCDGNAGWCRPAKRFGPAESATYFSLGFRLALPASPTLKTDTLKTE